MPSKLNAHNSIFEEIKTLIELKQEGGYWDFKRQWYDKNNDLLHDIICMANNLENRDAYIIVGIDESADYSALDVRCDPNRRNTQNLVDFLKDKKFAGGIRPTVYVFPVQMDNGWIDVVVIKNSHHTPFFLIDHYQDVCANSIYTRVMDTNTPKNRSADINSIEYLWRKRFYLDETPLEKVRHYLQHPEDWELSPSESENIYYYKYSPEYTIVRTVDEERKGYEFYLLNQIDYRPFWWDVSVRFHHVTLESLLGSNLDGGNGFIIAPEHHGISFSEYDEWDVGYRCYIVGSSQYYMHQFWQAKDTNDQYVLQKYEKCVLTFVSIYEQALFKAYVKQHKGQYDELVASVCDDQIPWLPDLEGYNMGFFKKEFIDAMVLAQMLSEFREK